MKLFGNSLLACFLLLVLNTASSSRLSRKYLTARDRGYPPQAPPVLDDPPLDEDDARQWLDEYNVNAPLKINAASKGSWNYDTNLTESNLEQSLAASKELAEFTKRMAGEAGKHDWESFNDKALKREFSKIVQIGDANLPVVEYEELTKLGAELVKIYSTAKVCERPREDADKCYPLDPDLSDIMASSKDLELLRWAWQGWRDASGSLMPLKYKDYTDLQNKAAINNKFKDNGDYWRSWYESATFREDCERLYQEIKPFYEQLHAYVRRKLKEHYEEKGLFFPPEGHIPAHILGNMWAQSWENLESLVKPEPEKPDLDITAELIKQGYDVDKIFKTSEEFFESLGFPEMTKEFWNNSMMERPKDRDVVCHASAWDFFDKKDFRIKQCTEVNQKWFMTTHHEMGHIAYYQQYKEQPVQFKSGANPGFHEAQADIASLSVATPSYLTDIGLILPAEALDDEPDLNFLMQQALTKIAFLPFGYMIDQWRWGVFDGTVKQKDYNKQWWNDRCKYQGLSPPVDRADDDFDAGSKFHVPNNTPYIRYFVAHIIQFQFHEALCKEAGNTKPLHQCSIHKSKKAGEKLSKMLQLGASKPWSEAMKEITGQETMQAKSLLEYFKPLIDWLKKQNEGHDVGWEEECPEEIRAGSQANRAVITTVIGSVLLANYLRRLVFLW